MHIVNQRNLKFEIAFLETPTPTCSTAAAAGARLCRRIISTYHTPTSVSNTTPVLQASTLGEVTSPRRGNFNILLP